MKNYISPKLELFLLNKEDMLAQVSGKQTEHDDTLFDGKDFL